MKTDSMKKLLIFIYPILSGILLGIGFVFPALKSVCWVAIIPLLYFLYSKELSAKRAFWGGYIAGVIFIGQVLIWFFHTLPLDWNGVNNQFLGFLGLFFINWVPSVFFTAIFIGLFSLGCHLLAKKLSWRNFFFIPAFWVLSEYARAFGFSILSWGQGSLLGPHWTWDNLAYLLNENQPLRMLASVGGIYLVSLIIIFINTIFFLLVKNLTENKKLRIINLSAIFILILLIIISYWIKIPSNNDHSQPTVKINIIQTNSPAFFTSSLEDEYKRFKTKESLFEKSYQNSPNIIILPEDSRFLTSVNSSFFKEAFGQKQIFVVDSSRTETPAGLKSIIYLLDSTKSFLGFREKILLSPSGEYLPYIIRWPIELFNKNWIRTYQMSRGYIKGDKITIFSIPDKWKFGASLCSEIFSPQIYNTMVSQGAEFLLNLGSLSFSHGSKILNDQTQSVLQFRAAENGRYLARATNVGYSYLIDNNGNIIKKSSNMDSQIIQGEIMPLSGKTPYAKYGDWILVLSLGIALLFAAFKIRALII